jgi:hypothetical protein
MSGTKTAFEIIDSACLAPKTPYRSDERLTHNAAVPELVAI